MPARTFHHAVGGRVISSDKGAEASRNVGSACKELEFKLCSAISCRHDRIVIQVTPYFHKSRYHILGFCLPTENKLWSTDKFVDEG